MDWLILTLPLTSQTRGMIGDEEFALMKPSAHLINIARGPTVKEESLVKTLKEGRLAGASLDVFEVEPLPASSELWNMRNGIISSRMTGILEKHFEALTDLFCDNLKRFMAGEKLLKLVDKSHVS